MSGSKYTLELEAKVGGAVSNVNSLEGSMGKLNAQVSAMSKGNKSAERSLNGLNTAAKGAALMEMSNRMAEWGDRVLGFGTSIAASSSQMVQGIVQDASTFEDAESSMRFAFGEDKWENMFGKVKSEAADLTFMFSETLDLAASMGRIDVNPFGTTGDDLNIFKAKTGAMVSAFQVLQDTSDATGRSASGVALAVKNALGGQFRMLKEAADIGPELFETWKDDINAASTQQEKYNVLIEKLATQFGGAGALKAGNFSKTMAQLPDLLEMIRAGIGKSGLRIISKGIQEIVDAFAALLANKGAMKGMSDAFEAVAGVIAFVASGIAAVVRWTTRLLEKVPALPTIIIVLLGIAAATSIVVGTMMLLAATLAGVVGLFMILGAKAMIGIALALPVFMALGAVMLVVAGTAVALVAALGSLTTGTAGSLGVFEKLKILWTAIVEIFQTFNGTTAEIGTDTARNLKAAGLYEFAQDVVGLLRGLNAFWTGLKAGWSQLTSDAGPALQKMMKSIGEAVSAIAEAFGFDEAATSTEGWTNTASKLVGILTTMVILLAQAITFASGVVKAMAKIGMINAIVYTLIAVMVGLMAVIVLVGVVALISMIPIILVLLVIGAIIGVIIGAFMMLYDAIVFVGEALGIIDEKAAGAADSTSGLVKELNGVADVKLPDVISADANKQMLARGGGQPGARPFAPAAISQIPGMPQLPPGIPGGAAGGTGLKPGAGIAIPQHVLPPQVQGGTPGGGGDMSEVVSAVNGVKASVESLGARIGSQQHVTNVLVDGHQIAEIIKSYDDGVNGGNN